MLFLPQFDSVSIFLYQFVYFVAKGKKSLDKLRNSCGPLHHWKSYMLCWLRTRESSLRESFPCLNSMGISRYVNCYLQIVLIQIKCINSNNFVEYRAACGFSTGLYFSLYIQHLQSHIIWIYLVTAEGSSMAITQTSFMLLKVILIMQIKLICWNGMVIWLMRECWVIREATTSRFIGGYMPMAIVARM